MLKRLLLSLLVALATITTFARDFEYTYEGQTLTYTVIDEDAKTCMTKEGDGDYQPGNSVKGDLIIPSTASDGLNSYKVSSIGNYAFSSCTSLTSITIPNSVTQIGNYAFSSCRNLISINIPNSATSIGDLAFEFCKSLTSITIPNSITSIGKYAFWGCSSLKEFTVENNNNFFLLKTVYYSTKNELN